ncbi:MAG TPA: xanthine dehydrogenase family protein molybdopterin-binding subunit [Candidatus Methylomirabilis sp.]
MGTSARRVDGRDKVTGRALYAGDLRLPGMLHGKVLRSPVPHARLVRVDGRKAETIPGVLAVLTRDDLKDIDPFYGPILKDRPIVAMDKVRFAGEPVALVAAVDEATAEAALAAIQVEYAELPAATDISSALAPGAAPIHERLPSPVEARDFSAANPDPARNICHHQRVEQGDVAAGFAEAERVFEDVFTFPMIYHYAMEPHTVVAQVDGEGITVWASAQHPFVVRAELARMFRVPHSQVRFIVPYLGGGFGSKSYTKIEPLAVALARKARRPVRLALPVEGAMHTVRRHGARVRIVTGVSRDGRILARECEVFLDTGAYADNGPDVAKRAAARVLGPYRSPHIRSDAYAVYTNTVSAGSMRAIGGPQALWACESQMDIIADAMGWDAVEFRRKNLLRRGERLAPRLKVMDADLAMALGALAEGIRWGRAAAGPGSRAHSPGSSAATRDSGLRTQDSDASGVGLACSIMNAGAYPLSSAIVRLHADGSASALVGSTEMGQGARTVMCQLIAEELALSLDQVRVGGADTSVTPFDRSTGASRSTTVMGAAVQEAARDVRGQLLALATKLLGAPPGEVRFAEGTLECGGRRVPYGELLARHFGMPGGELIGRGTVRPPDGGFEEPWFWEVGMGAAEAAVDRETGEVRVTRYVSVADVGRAVNPKLAHAQEEGTVVMGLGHTLFESLVYADGQIQNPNLIDYRVPRMDDVPAELESILIENADGPGPFGARGIGEAAILAVAPAVAGAVARATGVRIRDLPLTPERVWRALAGR